MMDVTKRHPDYFAAPLPENIFEWHFTLRGPYQNTPFVSAASPSVRRRGEVEEDGEKNGASPLSLSTSLPDHQSDVEVGRNEVGKQKNNDEEKEDTTTSKVVAALPVVARVEAEKKEVLATPLLPSSSGDGGSDGTTPVAAAAATPPLPPSSDHLSVEEMFSQLDVYQEPGEGLLGYEKGLYHGALLFSAKFPFEPPDIVFFTPQGRFECHQKICSTISSFHKEYWQPTYHVGFILQSLRQFMRMESENGIGALHKNCMTRLQKSTLARQSWDYYCSGCQCHSFETYRRFMHPYTMTTTIGESGGCPHPAGVQDEDAAPLPSTAAPPPPPSSPHAETPAPLTPLPASSASLRAPEEAIAPHEPRSGSGGKRGGGRGEEDHETPLSKANSMAEEDDDGDSLDEDVLFYRALLSDLNVSTLLDFDPTRTRAYLEQAEDLVGGSGGGGLPLIGVPDDTEAAKERLRIQKMLQEAERCRRKRQQEAEQTSPKVEKEEEEGHREGMPDAAAAPPLSTPHAPQHTAAVPPPSNAAWMPTTTTTSSSSFSQPTVPAGASSSSDGRVEEKTKERSSTTTTPTTSPPPAASQVPWESLTTDEWAKQLRLYLETEAKVERERGRGKERVPPLPPSRPSAVSTTSPSPLPHTLTTAPDGGKEGPMRRKGAHLESDPTPFTTTTTTTPPPEAAATGGKVRNIFASLDDDTDGGGPSPYVPSARVVFYLPPPRRALQAMMGIGRRRKSGAKEKKGGGTPSIGPTPTAPLLGASSSSPPPCGNENAKQTNVVEEEKGIPVTVHTLDRASTIFCTIFLIIAIHKGVNFFFQLLLSWWFA